MDELVQRRPHSRKSWAKLGYDIRSEVIRGPFSCNLSRKTVALQVAPIVLRVFPQYFKLQQHVARRSRGPYFVWNIVAGNRHSVVIHATLSVIAALQVARMLLVLPHASKLIFLTRSSSSPSHSTAQPHFLFSSWAPHITWYARGHLYSEMRTRPRLRCFYSTVAVSSKSGDDVMTMMIRSDNATKKLVVRSNGIWSVVLNNLYD